MHRVWLGMLACAGGLCAVVTGCPSRHAVTPLADGAARPAVSAAAEPMPPPSVTSAAVAEPAAASDGCPPLEVELPVIPMGDHDVSVPPIVDSDLLSPFYERMASLIRGRTQRPVRIAVYGDSNLTMDFITGYMRRLLQQRYGDAGHGFVALGRPWSHYKHMDVRHDVKGGFEAYAPSTNPAGDGAYGISGIAAESLWQNALTWIATAPADSPVGRTASRFEVFFWRKPKLGSFEIRIDGEPHRVIETAAAEHSLGHYRFELPDEAHRVEFVAVSRRGRVRLFGAVLERDVPGVVVDSFGVGSLNTRAMAREDPALNHAMLVHRGYDLIIFTTGANDIFTMDVTPKFMKQIIERHRQALPGVAVLIVSPADRGKQGTNSRTLDVIRQRRKIAADNSCAYWSLWDAMGGHGSMSRFRLRGLAQPDSVHFSEAGGEYVGKRLVYALLRELVAFATDRPKLGCSPPVPEPNPAATVAD